MCYWYANSHYCRLCGESFVTIWAEFVNKYKAFSVRWNKDFQTLSWINQIESAIIEENCGVKLNTELQGHCRIKKWGNE